MAAKPRTCLQHKLVKLTFFLCVAITLSLNTFGQHQLGVKASGGISRIYGTLKFRNLPPSNISTSFSPSFQAGLYYSHPISQKSSVGAELLFSQVEGGQTFDWDYTALGYSSIEGTQSDFTHESISYVNLPFYYGYTFKRLTFNAGFQISYAFLSSGRNESNYDYTLIADDGSRHANKGSWTHELNDLDIKDFDFGPRVGVIYQLTNRLSMEGMFYYGINNIKPLNSSEEELKIQQMTLGISYALWSDVENR